MKTRYRRIALALILFGGLAGIYLYRSRSNGSNIGPVAAPQQGKMAPDFVLKTTSGETVSLSDYRGQAVLINLWATWCPPCREEMRSIEKIYGEYKDQGFVVLAVNMTRQDNPERVMSFVAGQGLTYPILLDETGDFENTYQMRALPTSFFIDGDGIINEVVLGGPMAEASLRASVEKILK
jgi:peroxiredoxin